MFDVLVSVFFYIGIAALGFLILAVLLLTVFKTQDILREEAYEKMLLEEEEAKKAKVAEQKELSLKESLDLLKNEDTESDFNKEYVISYLKKKYKDEVILNSRENFTKTGLPLADTHFVNKDSIKKCFIYVYENNHHVMFLVNADQRLVDAFEGENKNISKSLFPKSKDEWFVFLIDSSYTKDDVNFILDYAYNLPLGIVVERIKDNTKELTLKESLALANESETESIIDKAFCLDYLKNKYKDEVICNSRENFTSTNLPLADTHFIKKDKIKKCFIYVYEKEGHTLLLANADHDLCQELLDEGKVVNRSLFPKSKDQWYSIPILDGYTKNDVRYILDYCYLLPFGIKPKRLRGQEVKEELTLKESLALAKESTGVQAINKEYVRNYLVNKYKDEVIVNERGNYTSTGLPLADTHYVNKDKVRKCFIYVYETEGSTLFLGNASEALFEELKEKDKVVSRSLFPKSKDLWITIPIDSSYTINEVNYVIDSLYGCHVGMEAELSESEEGEKHVAHHLSEVEIHKEATVEEANELISDEVVKEATEIKYVKSAGGKKTIINIDTISENFNDGDEVNIKVLKEKGLIQSKFGAYKVLARGVLNKKLKIVADDFSDEAIKMIILTGGEIIELKEKK